MSEGNAFVFVSISSETWIQKMIMRRSFISGGQKDEFLPEEAKTQQWTKIHMHTIGKECESSIDLDRERERGSRGRRI